MKPRWEIYLAAGHQNLHYTVPPQTTITRSGAWRIVRRLNRSRYAGARGLVFDARRISASRKA